MHQNDEEQRREFRELVAPGAGIVGGVAGTAVGLITAGPVGAFAGAVLGPTVEYASLRLVHFQNR